jgi:hypothetical protein
VIAVRRRAQVQKEPQASTCGPPDLVDEGYDMVSAGFHFAKILQQGTSMHELLGWSNHSIRRL